jgi:hypothetical protein
MERKMSPNTDLQSMTYMRRNRPRQNRERNIRTGLTKAETAKANIGAGKKKKKKKLQSLHLW